MRLRRFEANTIVNHDFLLILRWYYIVKTTFSIRLR